MEVQSHQHGEQNQSFRQNFQTWVDSNYGEHSRTKTITRAKYTKICRYLMGEEVETDAKFRFWVKSKAFRILRHQLDPNIGVLCVPVTLGTAKKQTGFDGSGNQQKFGFTEYRQVAVVDDFYSIIRSVHITERGVHVGQKKTYKAVSRTYAFLPREAVSYFLMSCNHCKLRIQTSNSIIVKHGVPPVHVDSDQEDLTDGEGSVSSNDKDLEAETSEGPARKRVKKEKIDNDYIHENGMDILDKFDSSPEGSDHENGSGDPEYLPNDKTGIKDEFGMMQSGMLSANLDSVQDDGMPSKKMNSPGPGIMGKRGSRRGGGGGRRLSYSPETDKQLLEWVVERSQNGLPVSREAIQMQALALVRDECPDFKASSGWVEKFLIRHKICLPTRASLLENGVRRGPPPLISNGTGSASTSPAPSPISGNLSDQGDKFDDGIKLEPAVADPDGKASDLVALALNRRNVSRKRGLKEDDEEEEEDVEDAEGECGEKIVPENVNPERLKAFNVFVRLFVDENLDRLVPISKQPKEKVLAIIHACHRQFPEFHDRARKRIRTYLKSCRRMKKPNEPLRRTADQINAVPSMSSAQMQEVNNILASACANEASLGERPELPTIPAPPIPVQSMTKPRFANGSTSSPVETSKQTTSMMTSSSPTSPALPSRSMGSPMARLPLAPESLAAARAKAGAEYKLNTTDVTAIRQLIASYRESAAFLYRSADELEALLPASLLPPQKAVR